MTDKQLYCKHCGVAVKPIDRGDAKAIGRGRLPTHVHVTRKSDKDPVQCNRINLYEEDLTETSKWS